MLTFSAFCTNQFYFPENGHQGLRSENRDLKDAFEEMEYEFPFGTFRPEKQGYLFKYFIATENLPLERPKKSCSIYFPTAYSGNFC